MTQATATPAPSVRSLRLGHILALLAVLVVVRAVLMQDKVHGGFSDNLMRLVQVREWLGGGVVRPGPAPAAAARGRVDALVALH